MQGTLKACVCPYQLVSELKKCRGLTDQGPTWVAVFPQRAQTPLGVGLSSVLNVPCRHKPFRHCVAKEPAQLFPRLLLLHLQGLPMDGYVELQLRPHVR